MAQTIRFDTNKNGQRVAYKWLRTANRWVRMNYEEAKLLESTESVSNVYYGPNCWKPGKFDFTVISETNRMKTTLITKVEEAR